MYRYRDDLAPGDAAFDVEAPTLEELFRQAADAALSVMVEQPESVAPVTSRRLTVEAEALDLLLLALLQELIYYKDAEQLLLRVEGIEMGRGEEGCRAVAEARGEKIDPSRHAMLSDVKAVTLHHLKVAVGEGGWEATVVLDL